MYKQKLVKNIPQILKTPSQITVTKIKTLKDHFLTREILKCNLEATY